MPRPEWRDPAKERHWRRMLRRWRRSGLTVRDFCAQSGLSEPSFYAWKREIRWRDQEVVKTKRATHPSGRHRSADGKSPAFMQVRIDSEATPASAIEVVVAQARVLRVRSGFDTDLFRQLVRLLEEPAC